MHNDNNKKISDNDRKTHNIYYQEKLATFNSHKKHIKISQKGYAKIK